MSDIIGRNIDLSENEVFRKLSINENSEKPWIDFDLSVVMKLPYSQKKFEESRLETPEQKAKNKMVDELDYMLNSNYELIALISGDFTEDIGFQHISRNCKCIKCGKEYIGFPWESRSKDLCNNCFNKISNRDSDISNQFPFKTQKSKKVPKYSRPPTFITDESIDDMYYAIDHGGHLRDDENDILSEYQAVEYIN